MKTLRVKFQALQMTMMSTMINHQAITKNQLLLLITFDLSYLKHD